MTVNTTGDISDAREQLARLAALLNELTGDKSAAEIHAEITSRMGDLSYDHRIAGVTVNSAQFAAIWTGVTDGSAVPVEAWETVVMPAVLAFSTKQTVKTNLGLATGLWQAARAAVDPLPHFETLHLNSTDAIDDTAGPTLRMLPAPDAAEYAPASSTVYGHPKEVKTHGRRRLLIAILVGLLVMAVVVVLWQQGRPAAVDQTSSPPTATNTRPGQAGVAPTPTTAPGMTTPIPPTAPASMPAVSSTLPAPTPSWTGPGPKLAPSAPLALTVLGTTETEAALSWQPPADPGTGGIHYYKIYRDGQFEGWTDEISATVEYLTPETTYTFTVTAHNGAGLASAPSSPVNATTQAPPPPPVIPELTTSPESPITLGGSFSVNGTGWPCTAPAQMNIYLNENLIAVLDTDAQGAFTAPITVDMSGPEPLVNIVNTSSYVTLTASTWQIRAELLDQPQCDPTIDEIIDITFQ